MSSDRRVLRYEVPVDDDWHEIRLGISQPILHVASRHPATVEFWAIDADGGVSTFRYFRVHGTGHPIEGGEYVGTALAAGGALVWHLFESTTAGGAS